MKRLTSIFTHAILVGLAVASFTATGHAANFNWTAGTTGDASGSWATSTFNGQAYVAADTLVINGAAGKTITTSGSITAPTLLTVSSTGASGNTITSNAGNPGATAVILTGTSVGGTLSKTGTADLVLSSANGFGAVTLSSGKFFLNNAAGLGTTGTLNVNSGAASGVVGSYAAANMANFFYDSTNINADYTFSKNITFGAVGSPTTYAMAMRGGATRTTTVSGNISGASNLTLWLDTSVGSDANSIWSLTGDNSGFAGTIRVNRGRLFLGNANAAGTGSIFLQTPVNAGGNLRFDFAGTFATNIALGTTAGEVISTNGNNINYTGVLSGASAWVKAGAGTLTLAGANTITGGTSMTAGTLNLSNSLALQNSTLTTGGGAVVFDQSVGSHAFTLGGLAGSTALALQDNAGSPNAVALTVGNNNTDATYSGALSGAGSLTKVGTGVQTLSSASSYSGGTLINNGTVAVGNNTALGTSAVNVAATAAYGASYISGGTPFLQTSVTGLTVANDIIMPNAAGHYALQMGAAAGGTVTWSGKLSGDGGAGVVLQIDTPNGGDATSMATLSNAANDFQGTIRLNRGRLALSNATAAGNADILLRTNVNATGNLLLNFAGNFATNISTVDAGGQVISTGANNINHTGILGGPSSWVKTGTGTMTLASANTISGGTSMTGGTLNLSHSLALQNSTLTTGGGTIVFDQSVASHAFTLGGLAGSAGLALQDNAGSPNAVALTVGNNNTNATYSGALSGAGSLIKVGTGEQTLSSASTYSGGTTINLGSVNIGNNTALGSGAVTVAATAQYGTTYVSEGTPFLRTTVTGLNVANDITLPGTAGFYALQSGAAAGSTVQWSGKIGGGAGVVLQIDTANGGDSTTMATLSNAANDFQGTIRLNRGRLTLSNATAAGSANLYLQTNASAAGNLVFGNAMTFANDVTIGTTVNQGISTANGDVTLSGVVSNFAGNLTGGINKVGANTLSLTNSANALTGPTAIAAGTLAISGAGRFNSSGTYGGNVSIASGATLRNSTSANQTLSGVISGTGNLIKDTSSASTLTLSSDNTFTGITTINAGTLALADGTGTLYETGAFFGAVGTNYVNINTGGTFKTWDWTHGSGFALSQLRSNYYTVSLNGGTIQFDDTFGALRAFQVGSNGGTLEVTADNTYTKQAGTTGSENIIRFTANSTLTLAGAGNGIIQDALGAYGSTGFGLAKSGSGTWTLSGANSYTGVTTVNGGTLLVTHSSGLGTTAGGTDVNDSGTLQLGTVAIGAEALTLEGAGASSTGALLVDGNVSSYAGAITLEAHSTIGVRNGGTLTLTGSINKNGFNVTFLGNGAATNTAIINSVGISGLADVIVDNMTVNLNASNGYVGPTTIQNGGILNANVADALPTGTFSAVSIDATSRLNLNSGIAQTVASLSGAGLVDNTAAGTNTLTISPSAGSTNFSGAITNSAGTLNVVKNGAGTQQLSGANTYSGSTTVNNGTLHLADGGLGNSDIAVTGGTFLQTAGTNNVTGATGDLTVSGSGQYQLQGGTLDFRDNVGPSSAWSPNNASQITTPTGAQFSFTGGNLVDVTDIEVTDGSAFTQSGGTFYVGRIGAGPAAETTIDGGFSLLGGVLRLDVFGADLTPEECCDGVAGNNDQLTVAGTALLQSQVSLNLVGSYEPEFGDVFTLICAEEITLGDGFFIDGGFFRIVPTGDAEFPFALQAIVPEPAAIAVWTLVGMAGIACAWRARRSKRAGA